MPEHVRPRRILGRERLRVEKTGFRLVAQLRCKEQPSHVAVRGRPLGRRCARVFDGSGEGVEPISNLLVNCRR